MRGIISIRPQSTTCFKKVLKMKLCLPRQKGAMIKTLIIFKLVNLTFNTFIPVSFPLPEATLNSLFCLWHDMSFSFFFFRNVLYSLR